MTKPPGVAAGQVRPDDARLATVRRTRKHGMQNKTTLRALTPGSVRPPFAAYSHGTLVPAGADWVFTSGQLGITVDDTIPEGAEAQADLCFAAIDAILQDAGFERADTVRINAFVTDRAHMGGYMAARDRWCAGWPAFRPPRS
jgi:enamine deaminase RidA (YjgF/YER057c/UK114 family)